ncbi:MAG: hypothetical protein C7B45_06295 [Sulfobacillus acidophilus]|uniref:ATP-binding protein n=1 Tax=Sulfobacillus acidophilus TaxID=53633 RepID=A0A2T2WJY6_9FIRM|nr:MAG: hypothetical protein C7B45_06295 [Sulfobacillus acidophilus]
MSTTRVIIEGLRSGIPYRETAETMTVGREEDLRAMAALRDAMAAGRIPKIFGQVIRAQYGEGKTHLLHALASAAWDDNWVVSMLSLSKESPLDRLDYLYPKIVQNILRPGSHVFGLASIVNDAVSTPMVLMESRDIPLSPRTRAVLDNLVRQNAGMEQLIADVEGQFLTLADLKRLHRENFNKPLKLASTRIKDEVFSYFALVDWLIVRAGYQGWLILFDEVELIGKFGRGARARSYVNLGRFLAGIAERTISAWAVAGNFQTDVLLGRHDLDKIPEWLLSRPQEAKGVELAQLAMGELSSARPLQPPSTQQIRELMSHVFDLHQAAYQWRAPVSAERFYDLVRENLGLMDARLRTWIRLGISLLDLWFLYGLDGSGAHVQNLTEMDLSEELESGEESDGVARRRIFE